MELQNLRSKVTETCLKKLICAFQSCYCCCRADKAHLSAAMCYFSSSSSYSVQQQQDQRQTHMLTCSESNHFTLEMLGSAVILSKYT